jgi:hypothetical protein
MIPENALTISIFKDGDQYCAVFTDTFEDLQTSDAGFGYTILEAISDLQDRSSMGLWA